MTTKTISEWSAVFGDEALSKVLATFSCPLNAEVENFLKCKAVVSSRLQTSQTYLVMSDDGDLLGYYTLVLKSFSVQCSKLSGSNRRLISRFAQEDDSGNFHAAVYLIAQIGKNYSIDEKNRIPGATLIGMALDEFRMIKSRVGGKLVMVEREADRPKLLAFYQGNGFKSWTKRSDAHDGVTYDQMFAII